MQQMDTYGDNLSPIRNIKTIKQYIKDDLIQGLIQGLIQELIFTYSSSFPKQS